MISPMKRLLILIAFIVLAASANVHTLATITGAGAAVQISTDTTTRATWIQIITPSSNAAAVMFGDSTTSATRGLAIAAGGGYNTPTCGTCTYTLAATYVYVANGDKVYVAFGD